MIPEWLGLPVSLNSETFWVAEPLSGHLPQIIQAWVIESWPQMERQDRQGQILFCVIKSILKRGFSFNITHCMQWGFVAIEL